MGEKKAQTFYVFLYATHYAAMCFLIVERKVERYWKRTKEFFESWNNEAWMSSARKFPNSYYFRPLISIVNTVVTYIEKLFKQIRFF